MEESFLASSFQFPTADDARYPSWVHLDKRAYFAHRVNATTRTVKTSTGHEVDITFCLADPPAVSYFCVHSPNIRREDYTQEPQVVSSAADLVLLCFAFRTGPRSTDVDPDLVEFFVYKAAAGSSIEPVPCSPAGTRHSWHASIVPRDGGNYLVAELSPRSCSGHYDLHVFSSETSEWSTTPLQLPTPAHVLPRDMPSQLDKAISLGGTMVGWVDLWRGIVFCDVLEKEPALGFIPLPKAVFDLPRSGQARGVRDVTFCCNGFINFVEIEHLRRELNIVNRRSFKTTGDLDTQDVIHDKELLMHDDLDIMDDKPVFLPNGWKIRTMFKRVDWDYWRKKHTVHVDDISAVPKHTALWDRWNKKWTLRNLRTTGFPFFSVYGDNVVYLMSKVEPDDKDSWIVGVDLEKKKFQVIKPYSAARCDPVVYLMSKVELADDKDSCIVGVDFEKKKFRVIKPYSAARCDPDVLPCAFSEYLNTNPRPYAAANCPQDGVLNNHLPDPIDPVASCGHNGVPNVQPQQNTWNMNGYYGSLWNGPGYGAHHAVYGNYPQPTPLQAQYMPPPNLSTYVQPMSPSTRSGYIYASWTDPDVHGRMLMTIPLSELQRMSAATFTPAMPPFAQPLAPSQTFRPPMTSTAGSYDVFSLGQQHHVKPSPSSSSTQGDEVDYYCEELGETDYYG